MVRARARWFVVAAGVAVGLGIPAVVVPAIAGAASGTAVIRTSAQAHVHRDGRSASDFDFDLRRSIGRVVRVQNSATADAHCANCRAVAISFQVVTISGGSPEVSADNVAQAINNDCVQCQTLAMAYQFVLVTSVPVTFTRAQRADLSAIERTLAALSRSTLPVAAIEPQVDALAARVLGDVQAATANAPEAADPSGRHRPRVSVHRRSHLQRP